MPSAIKINYNNYLIYNIADVVFRWHILFIFFQILPTALSVSNLDRLLPYRVDRGQYVGNVTTNILSALANPPCAVGNICRESPVFFVVYITRINLVVWIEESTPVHIRPYIHQINITNWCNSAMIWSILSQN